MLRPMAKTSTTIDGIIDAARTVFGEHGFDGATIEKISQRSGRSKQLIYHYFDGKAELYRIVTSQAIRRTFRELSEAREPDDDPVEAMRQVLLGYFDYFEAHPEIALLSVDQGLHQAIHLPKDGLDAWKSEVVLIESILTRGQERGLFEPSLTADLVYLQMFALVVGTLTIDPYFAPPTGPAGTIPRADWPRLLARNFLAGLRPLGPAAIDRL